MDNHLSAGWCWVSFLDINQTYNLFHIDRHDDLLDDKEMIFSQIVEKKIDISKIEFQEYCSLLNLTFDNFKLFRFDNYIINIHILFPDLFKNKYFATHEKCRENSDFVEIDVSFDELLDNLQYWVIKYNEHKWILNIDIDYFFKEFKGESIQVFTDEFIVGFANALKKALPNTVIITICLSPEFCGSWENSIRVCKLICDVLEVQFPYDEVTKRILTNE